MERGKKMTKAEKKLHEKIPRRKMLLIANPTSGRGIAKIIIPKLRNLFEKHDVKLDIYQTKKPRDAITKARAAAKSKKYKVIIACGGDGTVNEVLNGIASSGIKKGK